MWVAFMAVCIQGLASGERVETLGASCSRLRGVGPRRASNTWCDARGGVVRQCSVASAVGAAFVGRGGRRHRCLRSSHGMTKACASRVARDLELHRTLHVPLVRSLLERSEQKYFRGSLSKPIC